MKKIYANKRFIALGCASLVVIIAVVVMFLMTSKQPITTNPKESTNPTGEVVIKIPTKTPKLPTETKQPLEDQIEKVSILDVGGNPNYEPFKQVFPVNSMGGPNSTTTAITATTAITTSTQKPPSIIVTSSPDGTLPKDSEPSPANPTAQNDPNAWTPPAPGEGTGGLIDEGFESIKVNIDKSVETFQPEMGLLVGSELINAGYNTIYPNAGAPRDMVENAVKNYATTGSITLTPTNYGLPKIVGSYNLKLATKGTNVAEASKYVFEYIKNDKLFNDKVKADFKIYKDGWLSVYQKDGYFYIIFAVIDKGYSNMG